MRRQWDAHRLRATTYTRHTFCRNLTFLQQHRILVNGFRRQAYTSRQLPARLPPLPPLPPHRLYLRRTPGLPCHFTTEPPSHGFYRLQTRDRAPLHLCRFPLPPTWHTRCPAPSASTPQFHLAYRRMTMALINNSPFGCSLPAAVTAWFFLLFAAAYNTVPVTA